ncbi:flagellar biosynthesis protein FlhF [Pokkaliibacter sp. CJK22405]|uniref:flagellar biosynthesis protein FlhF n=1 Tax=Pokkaliibacter sp. CJK22405 TaxID=3384615 RepID=UPI003984F1B9
MKIKRFFAPDMRQAMRQVRQEVGPDAVILSNKRVAGGVEIMVAINYEPPEKSESPLQPEPQAPAKPPTAYSESIPSAASLRQRAHEQQARQGKIHEGLPTSGKGLDKESVAALLKRLESERKERQRQQNGDHLRVVPDAPASSPMPSKPPFEPVSMSQSMDEEEGSDTYTAHGRLSPSEPVEPPKATAPVSRQQDVHWSQIPDLPPSVPVRQPEPVFNERSDVITSMRGEIEQLKGLLEKQMKASQKPASFSERSKPLQIQIQTRLHKMGFNVALSRQLIKVCDEVSEPKQAWRAVLAKLAGHLSTYENDVVDGGGVFALVGPTGSGKTTTIGKLAARYVLKHGSAGLALVTTDCYRVAAHEQLRVFGHILDVPVRVVDERQTLNETLKSLRDKHLVLVDTAGMSAQDVHRDKQLRQLSQVSMKLRKLLVLPSTSQAQVLRSAYQSYRPLGLEGSVITKVDEAVNLGEVLSVVIEHALKVAYITDGQQVPDDLSLATQGNLISRAVHAIDNLVPATVNARPVGEFSRTG